MSNNSSLDLVKFRLQKFGARIIIEGAHIGEAKEFAETLVEKEKLTYINGYDDPPIVAGAGTIGMEVRTKSSLETRKFIRIDAAHAFLRSTSDYRRRPRG